MPTQSYDLPRHLAKQAMREADELIRKQHENGIFDDGDPNNPKYNNGINYTKIFGYDKKEFLRKQYI